MAAWMMIYAILLFLGQTNPTPVTITVTEATINMRCECTPCYWDCMPERTLLKQNKAAIALQDVQIQQLQLSLIRLTGAETPLPSWCCSYLETCDGNRNGRVDLLEFQRVQQMWGGGR